MSDKKEVEAFQNLYKDLLYIVDKHNVSWEWLTKFVAVYTEFGWEIGTALSMPSEKEIPS